MSEYKIAGKTSTVGIVLCDVLVYLAGVSFPVYLDSFWWVAETEMERMLLEFSKSEKVSFHRIGG